MPTMGNLPLNPEAGGEGHPFPAQGKAVWVLLPDDFLPQPNNRICA